MAPDASATEIREAYGRLAKELHPDRVGGAPMSQESMERFQEAKAAWFVLGNDKRRREYDEFGTLAAPPQAWSPSMWARLRSTADDGALMTDWGPPEPPKWLIFVAPISTLFLAIIFTVRVRWGPELGELLAPHDPTGCNAVDAACELWFRLEKSVVTRMLRTKHLIQFVRNRHRMAA